MTKQFGPLVKARNVPEPRHNEYRVTVLAVMRSRFSQNRERKKSDKSEGFKTNAVVSVFFFILSNKKG